MGAALPPYIFGHKKGSGSATARTPTEDPDSFANNQYLRLKEVISEGEIEGPASGIEHMLRDIYLNGTPIENADGTINFPDIRAEFRSGTQNQEPLAGFPASERIVPSGVPLEYGTPVVQQFNNTNLSAIRINLGFQAMQSRDPQTGDLRGYVVDYAVDMAMDGGPFQQLFVGGFHGKKSSQYIRSHRIDLPRAFVSWTLRVRRLTPQANNQNIQDSTFIQNFVEVVDAKLRHPMTALMGLLIDARTFSSPPTRAYRIKGRIVEVPSNYDPIARTYAGTWDGTFKLAWTNNPAWILRDLVTNDRYGTGDKVDKSAMNIYALYRIAQYCDELVPDGQGGGKMEPRFTCNVYIQTTADAMKVIQSLANIFRGAAYWSAGSVVAVADMPTDDLFTFTNANVIGGRFSRVGTARRTRYTIALVSYNDDNDFGRQKTIAVEDEEATARYGPRQTEVSAFGCTSPGQAYRVGQWILLSSQIETESITFKVSLERVLVMPGRVVKIADKYRAGRRIGGRITSATTNQIVMDALVGVRPGDRITVNLPSGICETRTVVGDVGTPLTADMDTITADQTDITADMTGLPGDTRIVNVSPAFSERPESEAQWALESEELNVQRYRILAVDYQDGLEAEVSAIQHEPGKYSVIDYNTRLSTRPVTIIPSIAQKAPTNPRISQYVTIDQNQSATVAVFEWDQTQNAIEYGLEWRRDDSDWIKTQGSTTTRFEVRGVYAGKFAFRVRAIGGNGASSGWAYSPAVELDGFFGDPPALATLQTITRVFGIGLQWSFSDSPGVIGLTEIWYSRSNDLGTAIKVGDFAYPQDNHMLMNLQAGTSFYFWGRVRDKNGVAGAFYPAVNAGVLGTTSVNAYEYLEYFEGIIGNDQLASDLRTRFEDLEVGVGDVTTKIEQEKTLREEADLVLAQTIDTVSARATEALGEAQDAAASVVVERTARIDQDAILATDIDTVRAATNTVAGQVDTERTARINADGVLAQSIETVRVTANGASAGVQTNSQAIAGIDGSLKASYSIRAQINQFGQVYAAGMTLGVYNTGQGMQSSVYFLADRFALLNEANGALTVPFIIENGTTYINRAFIGAAWIQTANIADAAITNAKIVTLDAGKITFGQMSGDRVEANSMAANLLYVQSAYIKRANIQELAVDTLRIADQSVVIVSAFAVDRTIGSSSGDNLLIFPVNYPALANIWFTTDISCIGDQSAGPVLCYFGGNLGFEGQGTIPFFSDDKFALTRTRIITDRLSGARALHILVNRPAGGTRRILGNLLLFGSMK